VRRLLLLVLLAGLVAPAGAAQACDIVQVESLVTELPATPSVVPAGKAWPLTLRITRSGVPASGIEVFATLNGRDFAVYKGGVTADDGTATLPLALPRSARGPLELDVEAYRTLVNLPCASVEEYDRSAQPWGRVR
jgi:hypothetical protein